MRKTLALLALLAGCGSDPALPQYMQDLPRTEEETQRVAEEIRRELGEGTRVERVAEYFFVASNESADAFERSKATVDRVYRRLYQHFFTRKPQKPIRVYLFRNKETYEDYCRAAYRRPPTTPYGFYMPHERKMVMNIGTGTGTLAHELVHPLLAEDFPEVPSWFNEGFASLYEESEDRGGRMLGLVNWRLRGLQKAIREEKTVSIREVLESAGDRFYGDDRGLNYAVARYLCLWLQEKGLLADYYRRLRADIEKDRSGQAALEGVTGRKLEDLEKDWLAWVRTLRYPR